MPDFNGPPALLCQYSSDACRRRSCFHLHDHWCTRCRPTEAVRPRGGIAEPTSRTGHILPSLLLSQRYAGTPLGGRCLGSSKRSALQNEALGALVGCRLSFRHYSST